MVHIFPKSRQEWLSVLVFPFEAYAVLGHCATLYLLSIWSFRSVHLLNHFADQLLTGYIVCFFVLLPVGLYRIHFAFRVRGWINFGLALWCISSIFIPDWVQA